MKKAAAILIAVLLCFSVTACDSKEKTSRETVLNTIAETSASTSASVSAGISAETSVSTSVSVSTGTSAAKEETTSVTQTTTQTATQTATQTTTQTTTQTEQVKVPVIREINRLVLTPADRYYLTDAKTEAYRKAMNAVFAHQTEVSLTDSYDDNLAVYGYIQNSPYSFILSDYDITKDHKGMRFEYAYSAEECTEMMEFIDREYLTLLNEIIRPDMTQLEKVLAVYRYFAQRISYDYEWLEAFNSSDDRFLFPDIEVYQALKTNRGVCHTYTYLCEFAFQQLGIDCIRAFADVQDSDESHMWLIVWIDGTAFHIDPTWASGGDGIPLSYFGMTDEENIERGMVNNWQCVVDIALDSACTDTRFAAWRDIVDFELIGNHRMKVIRSDGETEIIDLTQYR